MQATTGLERYGNHPLNSLQMCTECGMKSPSSSQHDVLPQTMIVAKLSSASMSQALHYTPFTMWLSKMITHGRQVQLVKVVTWYGLTCHQKVNTAQDLVEVLSCVQQACQFPATRYVLADCLSSCSFLSLWYVLLFFFNPPPPPKVIKCSFIKYSLSLCSFSQASKIKTLYEALSEFDRRPLKYEVRTRTSGRTTGRFGRSIRPGYTDFQIGPH